MTLQPYRYARPHDPATCAACAPTAPGPGHPLCQHPGGCGQVATAHLQRHATAQEYAALPERLTPIDGVALQAVYACDEHGEDLEPLCRHPIPAPAACPTCAATGTEPCLTAQGAPRDGHHQARKDAQPPSPALCRHAHRENCLIFTGCKCSQDDPPPERPKRVVAPPPPPGPAPVLLPIHGALRALLEAHGVDVDRILRTELIPRGDGTSTVLLTVTLVVRQPNGDLSYDDHGDPRTEVIVIELRIPRPTDPVTPDLLAPARHGLPPGPGGGHAATPLS